MLAFTLAMCLHAHTHSQIRACKDFTFALTANVLLLLTARIFTMQEAVLVVRQLAPRLERVEAQVDAAVGAADVTRVDLAALAESLGGSLQQVGELGLSRFGCIFV
jgi:hypothetical protein